MRLVPSLFSLGLVIAGLWMIAAVFIQEAPPEAVSPTGQTLTQVTPNASPQIFGTALIAGGVLLFIIASRR